MVSVWLQPFSVACLRRSPYSRGTPLRRSAAWVCRLGSIRDSGSSRGDIYGPKPYKIIGFGDIHGPKPYKFNVFGAEIAANVMSQRVGCHLVPGGGFATYSKVRRCEQYFEVTIWHENSGSSAQLHAGSQRASILATK